MKKRKVWQALKNHGMTQKNIQKLRNFDTKLEKNNMEKRQVRDLSPLLKCLMVDGRTKEAKGRMTGLIIAAKNTTKFEWAEDEIIPFCGRINRFELKFPWGSRFEIQTCTGCGQAWIVWRGGKELHPLKRIKQEISLFHLKKPKKPQ